jgi:hypothetical protein
MVDRRAIVADGRRLPVLESMGVGVRLAVDAEDGIVGSGELALLELEYGALAVALRGDGVVGGVGTGISS